MIKYHDMIANAFSKVSGLSKAGVLPLIEYPPQEEQCDRAIPCFRFSKAEKKSPDQVAKDWAAAMNQNPLPK